MKILIAYYSRRGRTEKVARALKEELERRNHSVDLETIKPIKEHSWRVWFFIRLLKRETQIQKPKISDLSKYDVICLGSPNWSRLSLPMARYLKEIKGIQYKNVGVFGTTAFWPQLEKYLFSAFLFDFTFARAVNKKGGRIIVSQLFSCLFKACSVNSNFGRKALKMFANKLETPIISLKDYFLEQRELERTRLLLILFFGFLLGSLVLQSVLGLLGEQILTWLEFSYLFVIGSFAYLSIFLMVIGKKGFAWAKYLVGLTLISGLTIATLFLTPSFSRLIILGYVLVFVFLSFLYDSRAVLFTGVIALLSYVFLLVNFPIKGVLFSTPDLISIFLSFGVTSFISRDLKDNYVNLLEAQDEMEIAKAALEIKVEARTRKLRELSKNLEGEVRERTRDLEIKVEELERFNRLSVDRELKMIELKKEIKDLKKKHGNK